MLTYNDVARNVEPRVHHSNILKLGITKRRWRTLEFASWRGPQQHFGNRWFEKVNGTAVLLKDTRSSETEKAGGPQPIKEIQREDPIEASSVWGIKQFWYQWIGFHTNGAILIPTDPVWYQRILFESNSYQRCPIHTKRDVMPWHQKTGTKDSMGSGRRPPSCGSWLSGSSQL